MIATNRPMVLVVDATGAERAGSPRSPELVGYGAVRGGLLVERHAGPS